MNYFLSLAFASLVLWECLVDARITFDPDVEHNGEAKDLLDGRFMLRWTYLMDATPPRIQFGVRAQTTGFVGVGVSDYGQMIGSDMNIGWVDDLTGQAFISDRFAYNKSFDGSGLYVDKKQNVQLIEGFQEDGWTTVVWERPLQTDDCDDRDVNPSQTFLVYAYGATDIPFYHGARRGSIIIRRNDTTAFTSDIKSLDVALTNYTVPVKTATYVCQNLILPPMPKSHVVAYQLLVDTTSVPDVVHHAVIYVCPASLPNELTEEEKNLFMCLEIDRTACRDVLVAVGIGGITFHLPPEAGLPIGTGYLRRVVLQLHFTNQALRSNIISNAGIRLYYTSNLRMYDAGLLVLGPQELDLAIPGGQISYAVSNDCPASCTQKFLGENANGTTINILSAALHMHPAGSRIYASVSRGSDDGPYQSFALEDFYNFDYQQTQQLSPPVPVAPGDSLRVTCVYDTRSRTETTVGGITVQNENCAAYLYYYPAVYGFNRCSTGCFRSPGALRGVEFTSCGLNSEFTITGRPCEINGTVWNAPRSKGCYVPVAGGVQTSPPPPSPPPVAATPNSAVEGGAWQAMVALLAAVACMLALGGAT
eukprot:jgi/Mesvir1/586/Mv02028-RA.1